MDNRKLKRRSRQGALISSIGFLIILSAFGFASWKLKSLNTMIAQKSDKLNVINKSVESGTIKQTKLEQIIAEQKKQSNDLESQLSVKNENIRLLSDNLQLLDKQVARYRERLVEKQKLVNTLNDKIVNNNDSLTYLKKQVSIAQNNLKTKLDSVRLKEKQILNLNIQLKKLESEKNAYNSFLEKYSNNNVTNIIPKATSTKTGKYYNFKIWLDIPANKLRKISNVTYFFNHSSFRNPKVVVDSPNNSFMTEYIGWGCLDNMPIMITFNNGKEETIIFKMCEHINDYSIPIKGESKIPQKGNNNRNNVYTK